MRPLVLSGAAITLASPPKHNGISQQCESRCECTSVFAPCGRPIPKPTAGVSATPLAERVGEVPDRVGFRCRDVTSGW